MAKLSFQRTIGATMTLLLTWSPYSAQEVGIPGVKEKHRESLVFLKVEAVLSTGEVRSATGTGFLVGDDGYVLSTSHLLSEDGEYDTASLYGSVGTRYAHGWPLDIIKDDPGRDLLLLRFKDVGVAWKPVLIGEPDRLSISDPLFTLGFPLDLDLDYKPGVVRNKSGPGGTWTTNAPLNHGDSGSPVFDRDGRVVGIVVAGVSQAMGIAYLMPINYAAAELQIAGAHVSGGRGAGVLPPPNSKSVTRASDQSGHAKLMWSEVAGATGYHLQIQIQIGGIWASLVGDTNGLYVQSNGFETSIPWSEGIRWRVAAIDKAGNDGEFSDWSPINVKSELIKLHQMHAREMVEKLSTDDLVSQLMMVGVRATEPGKNDDLLRIVADLSPGAVILYEDNLRMQGGDRDPSFAPRMVARLTRELQDANYQGQQEDLKIPLLIAVDQEGGFDVRVERGVTRIPNAMFIGATHNACLAAHAGGVIAAELRALGINMNLAPVADVNSNSRNDVIGKRAFGAHPALVGPMAVAFAEGMRLHGVIPVAKHFPGHGSSGDDPHFTLPITDYAEMRQLEMEIGPFKELVDAGSEAVMTAHLVLRPLGDRLPATFSRRATYDLLRRRLNFKGVIITDDLVGMVAALFDSTGRQVRTHEEAVIAAFEAGHDIVLLGKIAATRSDNSQRVPAFTVADLSSLHRRLVEYYEDDLYPERMRRLRESVVRVLSLKFQVYGVDNFENPEAWADPFQWPRHKSLLARNREVADAIAEDSVILISERGSFVEDPARDSRLFKPSSGPMSLGVMRRDADRITIAAPMKVRRFNFSDDLRAEGAIGRSQVNVVPMIYGWSSETEEVGRREWGEAVVYGTRDALSGRWKSDAELVSKKAAEIIERSVESSLIVMGIVTMDQVEIATLVARQLKSSPEKELLLLLMREPYFLPLDVYDQANVSVVFGSMFPNTASLARVLYGSRVPKGTRFLPVGIPPRIPREVSAGVPVTGCANLSPSWLPLIESEQLQVRSAYQ